LGNDLKDTPIKLKETNIHPSPKRLIHEINSAFHSLMGKYDNTIFIGEDILSPYGGAFKATEDLSEKFPERVFTTPISEAAIVGVANGLALKGFKPVVEIMFGDFITLAFDQIVNHASKFYHMYNKKISCPVIIRTPMGGKRGYGPTHSQSLEKFLIGIDNLKVIALNNYISPLQIYETIVKEEIHPVIVIENKDNYSKYFANIQEKIFENYKFETETQKYPLLRWTPKYSKSDISFITYGGNIQIVFEAVEELYYEYDLLSEIIVLTQLQPLSILQLTTALTTSYIFVVEEGSKYGGFGSEVISSLFEAGAEIKKGKRIASYPLPIPASKVLESKILCNTSSIVKSVLDTLNED
jgi:2-oxoisovalerate dehydrogenase E1 component